MIGLDIDEGLIERANRVLQTKKTKEKNKTSSTTKQPGLQGRTEYPYNVSFKGTYLPSLSKVAVCILLCYPLIHEVGNFLDDTVEDGEKQYDTILWYHAIHY